VTLLKRR